MSSIEGPGGANAITFKLASAVVTHVIPLLSCWVKVLSESFLQETNPAQQQQLVRTTAYIHPSPSVTY